MKATYTRLVAGLALSVIALGVVACDEDDTDGDIGAERPSPMVTAIEGTGDRETPVAGAPRLTPGAGGDGGEATPFAEDATVIEAAESGETAFEPNEITVTAGEEVSVVFVNNAPVAHNIHFFAGEDETAETLAQSENILGPGESVGVTFTAPSEAGEYFFWCDVHTTNMTGTLIVE